ncbi:extracellular solute-binding protein [Micromonospora sp. WMMD1128]|uniref:ABC transporter substrate-binding protein n=1 Tax=Micromonospora sp. WMMD1128 TaxID=3015150 RepID=UPI00248C10A3|nr:extracellular solute-binding protein [Micromonospora sp. WMMD1128]WBB75630.1 extracellular solute-binding protein [Micromonospora sp. WMMD1128]
MPHPRRRYLAAAAVVLLAITGCGDRGGEAAEVAAPDGLESAAKEEGTVTLYSSVEEDATATFAKSFTDRYDVEVQVVRLTSAQLAQRFAAEAQAGAPAADALLISRTGFTADAIESGWLVPLADAGLPDFPGNLDERFVLPDEGTAISIIQPAGIAYNTDLVPAGEAPKTWADLLDPKWKGRIAIPDPASSASYIGEWLVVAEASGPDFLQRFAAQDLKKYASGVPAAAAVAAGEAAFCVMGLASHIVDPKAKGAPIEFVAPPLTSGAEVVPGVAANSRHPNAARLLIQYALSAEGSKVLADAAGAVSPYDTTNLPTEYVSPDLAGAKTKQAQVIGNLGLS